MTYAKCAGVTGFSLRKVTPSCDMRVGRIYWGMTCTWVQAMPTPHVHTAQTHTETPLKPMYTDPHHLKGTRLLPGSVALAMVLYLENRSFQKHPRSSCPAGSWK